MTKYCCDLCGKELDSFEDFKNEYKVKVKKRWWSFWESGWVTLDICKDCQEKMFNIYNEVKERED